MAVNIITSSNTVNNMMSVPPVPTLGKAGVRCQQVGDVPCFRCTCTAYTITLLNFLLLSQLTFNLIFACFDIKQ